MDDFSSYFNMWFSIDEYVLSLMQNKKSGLCFENSQTQSVAVNGADQSNFGLVDAPLSGALVAISFLCDIVVLAPI